LVWPGLVAPIIGPPLGGFITQIASWRWIFFFNVPLGILAFISSILLIKEQKANDYRPFDWLGFLLTSISCTALLYGMELFGRENPNWTEILRYCIITIIAVIWGVRHMKSTQYPLFDLKIMDQKSFSVMICGGSIFRMAIFAAPYLLPLMFQIGFGLSPLQSGSLILAVFAGNLAMKPATSSVLKRWGFRSVLIVNGLITALFLAICGFLLPDTPRFILLTVLFISGLSRSMQFTALMTLGFADIEPPLMSSASAFASMWQQIGNSMGVAFGAIALHVSCFQTKHSHASLTTADFRNAFILVGILAFFAIFDVFSLKEDAGAIVSGHHVK
jgi:MFS family permease